MLNLSVKTSTEHNGKVLQVNSETETVALIGPANEPLGTVSWQAVIDFIQNTSTGVPPRLPVRNYSRSPLAALLCYRTPDCKDFQGVTCEIGGGGIFIQTIAPPQIGTVLTLELTLPDDPARRIIAQGQVAWIRTEEEHHGFSPGIGVRFIEISEDSRARIVNMVKTLDRSRGSPSKNSRGPSG